MLCAGAVQWAEIGVWFSEDGATGHAQNGTMPPLGGRTRGAPHTHARARGLVHGYVLAVFLCDIGHICTQTQTLVI